VQGDSADAAPKPAGTLGALRSISVAMSQRQKTGQVVRASTLFLLGTSGQIPGGAQQLSEGGKERCRRGWRAA
jgi:hypothetical protein